MRKKILFIHLGALGDFILTLPVIRAYRKNMPGAEIHICAREDIRKIALSRGWFRGGIDPEKGDFHRLFHPRGLRSNKPGHDLAGFDLILTTSWNPVFIGNLKNVAPRVLFPSESPERYPGHLQDYYFEHLLPPGFDNPDPDRELIPLDETRLTRGKELLKAEDSRESLIIHPGSGGRLKCWPLEGFIRVADELRKEGLAPVFLLGPVEAEWDEIQKLKDSIPCPVLTGLSLLEAAAVLANAEVYLGNDSGITHLAAALGRSVVAIFGPSDHRRYGPRGRSVRIISLDYECSPCHPQRGPGRQECGRDRACLRGIRPEMVIEAVRELKR